jgi:hypothetical protein
MIDDDFDQALTRSIDEIYRASTVKNKVHTSQIRA